MEYRDDEAKAKYISIMEWIIARHISTETCNRGKKYRYPVRYRENGKTHETGLITNLSFQDIPSMHYKLGAHRVDIGKALIEIVDFLQKEMGAQIDESPLFCPFEVYDDGLDEGVDEE